MGILDRFYSILPELLPSLGIISAVLLLLFMANWFLLHRKRDMGEEGRLPRRITMLVLSGLGIVAILLALPVSEVTRGQLLGLLGLLLTAVIALSSTTFVANAMAGLMLRAVGSYSPGDFVHIGEQFGRITERGLFHTEIQTEERDLATIPNLYLISHPITVVRSSGTVVSAHVSLGYDNPHNRIEELLIEAAHAASLRDPFVQIRKLGDFSVTYRVAGVLPEVKQILTARSFLRTKMLDTLHNGGIEIVSPTFMNQRVQREGARTLPPESPPEFEPSGTNTEQIPEELIFDKAEEAQKLEELRHERENLIAKIEELETQRNRSGEAKRDQLQGEIERAKVRAEAIGKILESAEKKKHD